MTSLPAAASSPDCRRRSHPDCRATVAASMGCSGFPDYCVLSFDEKRHRHHAGNGIKSDGAGG
jgi:hypothetical protein